MRTSKSFLCMARSRIMSSLPIIVIILLALAAIVAAIVYGNVAVDDAFIIFRVADNLWAGKGFVYNQGERLQVSSTPLYTVALFLFRRFGLAPPISSVVINSAALVFEAVLCFVISRRYLFAHFERRSNSFLNDRILYSILVTAVIIFQPWNARWVTGGMETMVVLAFQLFMVYSLLKENEVLLGVSTVVLFLLRIDTVIFLGSVFGVYCLVKREFPKKWFVIAGISISIYLLIAYFYFGSPIPHSVVAKFTYDNLRYDNAFPNLGNIGRIFLNFKGRRSAVTTSLRLALSATFLVSSIVKQFPPAKDLRWKNHWRDILKPSYYLSFAVYGGFFFLVFAFAKKYIHAWYLPPGLFAYFLAAGLGGYYVWDNLAARLVRHRLVIAKSTVLLLVAVCLTLYSGYQMVRSYEGLRRLRGIYEDSYIALGNYLKENTRSGDVVFGGG